MMRMQMKILFISGLFLTLYASQLSAQDGTGIITPYNLTGTAPENSNYMINIYDNIGRDTGGMIVDWGYSMYVSYNGRKILFDSGASAALLKNNAEAAGVNLADIDIAVLSHSHGDHTPGIHYLIEVSPDVTVYVPNDPVFGYGDSGNNKKYRKGYMYQHDKIVFVKENTAIADGIDLIYTVSTKTGKFSKYPPHETEPRLIPLPELSLALTNRNGASVLISGCSHTGIENIVRETKKWLKAEVLLVTGGFHLIPYQEDYIAELAKTLKDKLEVRYVASTHCTGEKGIGIFEKIYGKNFVKGGLASKIIFPQ